MIDPGASSHLLCVALEIVEQQADLVGVGDGQDIVGRPGDD